MFERNKHSADIRMSLHFEGSVLTISHLGPNYLILAEPVEHPPTRAEITMSVDGQESRWTVELPAGLSSRVRRTCILAEAIPNWSQCTAAIEALGRAVETHDARDAAVVI